MDTNTVDERRVRDTTMLGTNKNSEVNDQEHGIYFVRNYGDRNRSSKIKRLCVFSMILNVCLLLTSLILVLHSRYNHQGKTVITPTEPHSFCIHCWSMYGLEDYRVTDAQGRQMCCYGDAALSDVISNMVVTELQFGRGTRGNKQFVPQKIGTQGDLTSPEWLRNRTTGAHLYLDIPRVSGQALPWSYSKNDLMSYVSNDVTIVDGRIKVPDEGVYFVYSAITVNHSALNDGDSLINHIIQKQHEHLPLSGPEIIMIGKDTYGNGEKKISTRFLCGIFKLKEGFEITSYLSDPRFIYKFKYANFQGLFRL